MSKYTGVPSFEDQPKYIVHLHECGGFMLSYEWFEGSDETIKKGNISVYEGVYCAERHGDSENGTMVYVI